MNKKEIINYVTKNSWLDVYDDTEENEVTFDTREHGNILDCEYSEMDYKEAIRIATEVNTKFPVKAKVETVDEWVMLKITEKK